jgi:hypothetical protein
LPGQERGVVELARRMQRRPGGAERFLLGCGVGPQGLNAP